MSSMEASGWLMLAGKVHLALKQWTMEGGVSLSGLAKAMVHFHVGVQSAGV